jgi:hypothetical protein
MTETTTVLTRRCRPDLKFHPKQERQDGPREDPGLICTSSDQKPHMSTAARPEPRTEKKMMRGSD